MSKELSLPQKMIEEIQEIMIKAREKAAYQINNELLTAYWNIGRVIVEHEQGSKERAEYGKETLRQLSLILTKEFGKGFSRSNLQNMRAFYLAYPKCQTVSGKLSWSHYCELMSISDADRRAIEDDAADLLRAALAEAFPGRDLRVERDGSVLKILGDLSL